MGQEFPRGWLGSCGLDLFYGRSQLARAGTVGDLKSLGAGETSHSLHVVKSLSLWSLAWADFR